MIKSNDTDYVSDMDLFNVKEAAEYTKFSVSFIYKLTKQNKIPHVKIGRKIIFRKSDLFNWLGNMISYQPPSQNS